MSVAITVFPGSNCDHDIEWTYGRLLGTKTHLVWHREHELPKGTDIVVLPGGFSYGDYLRTGALAKISPIMKAVSEFAARGGPVLGICNGFQILCEAGLLPGVLLQNVRTRFLSQFVSVRVETSETAFTRRYTPGEIITCPIAHMDGNYFADEETLARLEGEGRVVFRYCTHEGDVTADANPNGSRNGIAGICNEQRTVVGLMPHPERAADSLVAGHGASCLGLFESVLAA